MSSWSKGKTQIKLDHIVPYMRWFLCWSIFPIFVPQLSHGLFMSGSNSSFVVCRLLFIIIFCFCVFVRERQRTIYKPNLCCTETFVGSQGPFINQIWSCTETFVGSLSPCSIKSCSPNQAMSSSRVRPSPSLVIILAYILFSMTKTIIIVF